MSKAKMGNKVKIHYTGYLKDGTVFYSTVNEDPVVFTIGEGLEAPGVEKAVIGMQKGVSSQYRFSLKMHTESVRAIS